MSFDQMSIGNVCKSGCPECQQQGRPGLREKWEVLMNAADGEDDQDEKRQVERIGREPQWNWLACKQ